MNQQVTDYINQASDTQKQLMETLRQLIHQAVPGVTEEYKWSRPVFKSGKNFAYLKAAKAYVTLGFFDFEKLEDKDNLLEGTGKDMRHIKIRTVNDIDSKLLKKWLKVAAAS